MKGCFSLLALSKRDGPASPERSGTPKRQSRKSVGSRLIVRWPKLRFLQRDYPACLKQKVQIWCRPSKDATRLPFMTRKREAAFPSDPSVTWKLPKRPSKNRAGKPVQNGRKRGCTGAASGVVTRAKDRNTETQRSQRSGATSGLGISELSVLKKP